MRSLFLRIATRRLLPAGVLLLLLAVLLNSCGPRLDHYVRLDRHVYDRDFDAALTVLRASRNRYTSGDTALYLMEEGLLSHYAGRYEESRTSLLQAEAVLEDLYTRSVSRQAAAIWINDNTIPFRGERFEDALVNLFLALNYTSLGLHDDALVEARQVDSELAQRDVGEKSHLRHAYPEDAFIRFITGVLYETDGELNDAFIAFRNAERIYRTTYRPRYNVPPPALLLEKLLCSATRLGFREEADRIRARYPRLRCEASDSAVSSAEVFLLHYNGPGPEKVETFWSVPMPDGYIAKIAYPQFLAREYAIARSRVRLRARDSGRIYDFETEPMEPIGAIAAASLETRLKSIKTRAVARATAKYLATKAAAAAVGEEVGTSAASLMQIFGNLYSVTTENADVRHWRTLPDEIRVGRVQVPAGGYEGEVTFVDGRGALVLSEPVRPFRVSAGEKQFIYKRTLQ